MIIEILNLLDIIKGEKLISSFALIEMISKLPIKYINITKQKNQNLLKIKSLIFKDFLDITKKKF